jgi:mannosyltransferase
MLMMATFVLVVSGAGAATVWRELPFVQMPIIQVYGLAVHALWFAPLYGWLLMISAWARRMPVLWAVLPPLAIWALSHGDMSYFYFRYMLFTVPAFAVLAGAGLATAARSRAVLASALALLGLLTLPEQRSLGQPLAHYWVGGPDYRAAARTIQKYYLPGDAIVYDRSEEAGMFSLGVRYYLPRDLRPRDVFLAESAADRDDLLATDCPEPARCLRDEQRIWLVVMGAQADPFDGLPPDQAMALRARYTASGAERPGGLTVALLERNR